MRLQCQRKWPLRIGAFDLQDIKWQAVGTVVLVR